MSQLHALRSDARGIAAVEFAMIAPALIALICGTIDIGYLYMAQSSLTGAVAAAARESASTQERSQADRDTTMRARITAIMTPFRPPAGRDLVITTTAYKKFGDTRPEDYTDSNGNGRYDPPAGGKPGESYVDRNNNGQWDPALPTGNDTGGMGDVVSYTATYPVPHLFAFVFGSMLPYVELKATSVVRNEPVKTV